MSDTLAQWQAAWPAVVTTALILPLAGQILAQRARQLQQQTHRQAIDTLDYLLGLMQQLQRHRALGGRNDGEARQQRVQLAIELDRLWSRWPQLFPDDSTPTAAWSELKRNAADFDGHCRLIDRLLAAIDLVERRVGDGGTTLGARCRSVLSAQCRTIEELGQLRGLSVRAAAQSPASVSSPCPVHLEVPLRYLCLRLADAGPEISNALREIEQRLLARRGPALTPADCFALLTPLIDRALDAARAQLHRQAQQQRTPSAMTLPILGQAATER